MAIYHFSGKRLQRSAGDSASGCAAYRCDLNITDGWSGKTYTQVGRHDHPIEHFFAGPKGFDCQQDIGEFFRQVDAFEKRKDATVGKEYEYSLPLELSDEQNREIVREFAQILADDGRVASSAIHWKKGNGHVHIWASDRVWNSENGWGKKDKKFDHPAYLTMLRERFADIQNKALEKAGLGIRVSHLTLAEQGIDRPAQRKSGKNPSQDVIDHNIRVDEYKKEYAERKDMEADAQAVLDEQKMAVAMADIDKEIAALENEIKADKPAPLPPVLAADFFAKPKPVGDKLTRFRTASAAKREEKKAEDRLDAKAAPITWLRDYGMSWQWTSDRTAIIRDVTMEDVYSGTLMNDKWIFSKRGVQIGDSIALRMSICGVTYKEAVKDLATVGRDKSAVRDQEIGKPRAIQDDLREEQAVMDAIYEQPKFRVYDAGPARTPTPSHAPAAAPERDMTDEEKDIKKRVEEKIDAHRNKGLGEPTREQRLEFAVQSGIERHADEQKKRLEANKFADELEKAEKRRRDSSYYKNRKLGMEFEEPSR